MATDERTDITEVKISEKDIEFYGLRDKFLNEEIDKKIDEIENSFKNLCSEFEDRFAKNEWILMTDNVFYLNTLVSLIPNIENCRSNNSSSNLELDDLDFRDFIGEIPTSDEVKKIFGRPNNYSQFNGIITCCDLDYYGVTIEDNKFIVTYSDTKLNGRIFEYPSEDFIDKNILVLPIYRLNAKNSEEISIPSTILKWIVLGIRPSKFCKEESRIAYNRLRYWNKKGFCFREESGNIVFQDRNIVKEKILEDFNSNKNFYYLSDVKNNVLAKNNFEPSDKFNDTFENELLNCDYKRLGLEPYKPSLLYDSSEGHWDLFDYNDSRKGNKFIKLTKKMYARNPEDDITNEWCAIDFGTKSTVVAYQDNRKGQKIIPLVLGRDNLNDDVENPTVIYFINSVDFFNAYKDREGRPNTELNHLTISHDALESCNNPVKGSYEAFLIDLKSWSNSSRRYILRDAQGEEVKLEPFMTLTDNDKDPLEYYAYLLGLFLNKMQRHRIFMRYKMSFPVKFPPNLCDKILDSFKRGIRKSFPTALINNKDKIDIFNVKQGYKEPVAYAITALEKYNFTQRIKKLERDSFYYSVFDFGGGTTDFDFGVYSSISDSKLKKKYKNKIVHFCESGIETLGGEKLLKYLAFEVFKLNKDNLHLSDGSHIQFIEDDERDSDDIDSLGILVSNSAFANRNMYNLMKELRWTWENPDGNNEAYRDNNLYLEKRQQFDNGCVKVNLIDNNGNEHQDFPLAVMTNDEIQMLLRKKIEFGIDTFFQAMKDAFFIASQDEKYQINDLKDIDEIAIFLAGNSTKSSLFRKILDEYRDEPLEINNDSNDGDLFSSNSVKKISKAKSILGLDSYSKLKLIVYPPLGTEEAKIKQIEYGYEFREGEKEPTGKTGVAYGLLIEKILVEEANASKDSRGKFRFYVGKDVDDDFSVVLKVGSEFDKWVCFDDEITEDDDGGYKFYYTTNPKANSGSMEVKSADGSDWMFVSNPQEGQKLYIRPINPNTIEYRVVNDEKDLEQFKYVIEKNCRVLK